jgi:preprotein translocase subunit SecE
VARNRKRRSDRRPLRPSDAEPGIATASAARRDDPDGPHRDETPDPIEHGTPDVDLAEAQLALGRPELAGAGGDVSEEELVEEAVGGGGGRGRRRSGSGGGGGRGGDDGELAAVPPAATPAKQSIVTRLIHFLQGSWRELQRVQWPDRRQVMQATGVVIGFVIVAGVFLGVADLVANKVVQFLLK